MRRTQVRCHTCGALAEVELTYVEERDLRAQGLFRRYCNECRGNSLWDVLEAPRPSRLPDAEVELSRGRILLIDDDESILTILGKALTQEHFDLETASSARAAITRLARRDYDVILSDIRMPEFDGKQLFKFLDQHMPEYKERVIFLTGDTGNPETMEFLEKANCPYLVKPIDIPALFGLINRFLPQSHTT